MQPQVMPSLGTTRPGRHVVVGVHSLLYIIVESVILRFLHGIVKHPQGAPELNRRHCKDTGRFLSIPIVAVIGIMVIVRFSGMSATSMSKWNPM